MQLIRAINIISGLLLAITYATPIFALNSDYTDSYFWSSYQSKDATLIQRINTRQFDIDKISIMKVFLNEFTSRLRFETFLTIIDRLNFESSKLHVANMLTEHIERPTDKQQCRMLQSFSSKMVQNEVFNMMKLNEKETISICDR